MINEKTQQALNQQINEEVYSAYLYLSMSAFCSEQDLPGFANWFRAQFEEEMEHVMRFYDYMIGQGGIVKLAAVAEPTSAFGTPLEIFETTLEHERHITGCINKLMDTAIEQSDHATRIFLQWFVNEQVEEEGNVSAIIGTLKRIQNDQGLLMLDKELGQRAVTSVPAE